MNATLLLNASYEPLRIISWKKALTLLFAGKVEVIDEYDHQVHAITFAIKLPSIIRLLKYVRVKRHNRVKFSRANIYARDDYTCQYCGKKFPSEDLTFDHVMPVAMGGQKRWDNIVAACFRCNHKKGEYRTRHLTRRSSYQKAQKLSKELLWCFVPFVANSSLHSKGIGIPRYHREK